jgi:hypothetical protein
MPRGYISGVAMTLRLTDEQTEALRRRAKAEQRSMQQVVLAAIEAYVRQPVSPPQRREAVQVKELLSAFAELPSVDVNAFRADRDRHIDSSAHLEGHEQGRE